MHVKFLHPVSTVDMKNQAYWLIMQGYHAMRAMHLCILCGMHTMRYAYCAVCILCGMHIMWYAYYTVCILCGMHVIQCA